MSDPRVPLAEWKEHYRDEADAAFSTGCWPTPSAIPSERHLPAPGGGRGPPHAVWSTILADHDVEVPPPRPSVRARLFGWTARRFGPGVLSELLLREEGREVKGYWVSSSGPPTAPPRRRPAAGPESASTRSDWVRSPDGGASRGTARGRWLSPHVVYGFNDGLTANFGLVAGVLGADVAPRW